MPAFNAEPYLGEAIESVPAQTFRDHELIVVDDGSTDRTPAVVGTYQSWTRVLRQPHAGVAAARKAMQSVAARFRTPGRRPLVG